MQPFLVLVGYGYTDSLKCVFPRACTLLTVPWLPSLRFICRSLFDLRQTRCQFKCLLRVIEPGSLNPGRSHFISRFCAPAAQTRAVFCCGSQQYNVGIRLWYRYTSILLE